jgi:predicted permease
VLSHAAWIRLFGGDPAIVGRTVELNQLPYQILGVMKPDFRWPQGVDLWKPAGLPPEAYAPERRFSESTSMIVRLRPGVSPEQAQAWLTLVTDRVHQANAKAKNSAWRISLTPFVDATFGQRRALLLLLGSVALVLLIACANIAGLMIARTSVRARELAVRAALGASRLRLIRQIFSESVLLAAAGGVAGLAFAAGAIRLLLLLSPAAGLTARLDPLVLGFCAAATAASGLLFGLASAWQVSGLDSQAALKTEGRSSTLDARKQRLRSVLVVGETAVALTLLVVAGLFLRSFVRLQSVNPGFDAEGVMTAIFFGTPANIPPVLERVRSVPGVTAAGVVWPVPFTYNNQGGPFAV